VARHLYDIKEQVGRERVATQLRLIADQIERGKIDLAYDEYSEPTPVTEPIRLILDVIQHRHEVELSVDIRWDHDGGSQWPALGGLR